MPGKIQTTENAIRLRRSHKKSRKGCRNCKLRRVKCDEIHPKCDNCTSYGVSCNYGSATKDSDSDLQLFHNGEFSVKFNTPPSSPSTPKSSARKSHANHQSPIPFRRPPSPWPATNPPSLQETFPMLPPSAVSLIVRFGTRTVLTIGPQRSSNLYAAAIPKLVWQHPYLLHCVQTITLFHDHHLSLTKPNSTSPSHSLNRNPLALHHFALTTSLFNTALTKLAETASKPPLPPPKTDLTTTTSAAATVDENNTKDALWATAALIGCTAFCSLDARTPHEAWPLAAPSPTDLEWLRMSLGKSSIWDLTDPLRPSGAFAPLKDDISALYKLSRAIPTVGVEGLPVAWVELCELDDESTAEANVYYAAVRLLAPLMEMDCDRRSIVRYLGFVSHMSPQFYGLLERKDPRALLLLGFWYAKIGGAVWWCERRAELECKSVCLFLEREFGHWGELMRLLRWPKWRVGFLGLGTVESALVEVEWQRILELDL